MKGKWKLVALVSQATTSDHHGVINRFARCQKDPSLPKGHDLPAWQARGALNGFELAKPMKREANAVGLPYHPFVVACSFDTQGFMFLLWIFE